MILLLSNLLISCSKVNQVTEVIETPNLEVLKQESEELLVDQQKIIQQAKPQKKEVTIEITHDWLNQETKREIVKESIIEEGQPQIIEIGVKEIKERTELIKDPEIEVIREENSTLEKGVENIKQEGRLGEKKITYEEVYIKGELRKSLIKKSEDVIKAVPKIIEVGSKIIVIEKPVEPPLPIEPNDNPVMDNKDLSWWFQPGNPKATISNEVASIIKDMNVYWQIPTEEKVVYLTMDQGYEYNNNTSKILDTLKSKGIKVTFFITGSYYDNNREIVQRMFDEGHQVANHTEHHYRAAPTLDESKQKYIDDIMNLQNRVSGMVKLHRPPEGGYSKESLSILKELGFKTVFWSFAYKDWLVDDQPNLEEAKKKILDNIHPGSIILLHSVSNTNTTILGDVIDGILAKGYQIKLLP